MTRHRQLNIKLTLLIPTVEINNNILRKSRLLQALGTTSYAKNFNEA
ncbi:MAG TPA: hypothetical protein VK460_06635 [Burkholderiales bacterium]|nr:hypothetical protein [Burkholderiales bacterium]